MTEKVGRNYGFLGLTKLLQHCWVLVNGGEVAVNRDAPVSVEIILGDIVGSLDIRCEIPPRAHGVDPVEHDLPLREGQVNTVTLLDETSGIGPVGIVMKDLAAGAVLLDEEVLDGPPCDDDVRSLVVDSEFSDQPPGLQLGVFDQFVTKRKL